MKLEKDFKDVGLIREKLVNKLPDSTIIRLASILMVDTKNGMYLVKVRNTYLKEDGDVDIEKLHKMIKESDFIEISTADYRNIGKHENITNRTMQLITPGANIIFKMNIDIDKFIQ